MMKIALLGGSFNPFHNGHLAMLKATEEGLKPDVVMIMPSKKPPHKISYKGIKDSDRLNMLKTLEKDFGNIIVSDMELSRPGFTYTKDTLSDLAEMYPDAKLYFIMGGDSIMNFDKWNAPNVIAKLATICICARDKADYKAIEDKIDFLKEHVGGEYIILDFDKVNVSSTLIRSRLEEGLDCSEFIPKPIYEYILANNLYIDCNKPYTFEELIDLIQMELSAKRFNHSIGVMNTAIDLAKTYGLDQEKARIAGILHDIAKPFNVREIVNICRQNGKDLTEEESANDENILNLGHAKAGSIIAKNIYFIEDEDILSAIYYHTVGRPNMSLLEKIIFVADYIEPNRTQPTNPPLDDLRELAFIDIDKCVALICENTINYLKNADKSLVKSTVDTYNYYKKSL